MKLVTLLSTGALAFASLPLAAQQADASVAQSASATTTSVSTNQSANAAAQAGPASAQASGSSSDYAQMRPVNTTLVGKLDSKSAKAGDAVVVKTTQKLKTAEGLMIPKGSRLIGHVASVQAHGSGHPDSALSLVFDRAELKGGQSLAIRSMIETVAPPAGAIAASEFDSDSSMAMPAPMAGVPSGGSGRLGGGLVGGSLGAASSMTGGAGSNLGAVTGGAASSLGSTTSATLQTTTGLAGRAGNGIAGGLDATTATTGSLATHATRIPGVMLAGDASGSASGTLTAARKNIHLDSGTQIMMSLSGAVAR